MEGRIEFILEAIADITEEYDTTPEKWNGTIKCPLCKQNLNYSIAKCNGHIHGQCSTKDCISWMM